MSIQHKDISEANLHECKGASTASAGQLIRANGLGTAEFSDVIFVVTATASLSSIVSSSTSERVITVSGVLAASDKVLAVNKATFQSGIFIPAAVVTADNQITIELANVTAGTITPTANDTYTFVIFRA